MATPSESALVGEEHYISLRLQPKDEEDQEEDEDQIDQEEDIYPRVEPTRLADLDQSDAASDTRCDQRWTILLYATGVLSTAVGILFLVFGLLELFTEPSADAAAAASDSMLQVRSKFSMLVLIIGGVASIAAAVEKRASSCLLVFSFLSVAACCCDFLMQFLSRRYVPESGPYRIYDSIGYVLSLIGAAVSMAQVGAGLSLPDSSSASECEPGSESERDTVTTMDGKRRKPVLLFGVGIALVIEGMSVVGITLASYTELQRQGVDVGTNGSGFVSSHQLLQDVKWTLSSDLITHGWLIAAAGASLSITAVYASRCRLWASLALIGAAGLTTASNCVHPLADFYIRAWTSGRETNLSVAMLLVYAFVLALTGLAAVNLIGELERDATIDRLELRQYVEKRGWQLYNRAPWIQTSLAVLYLIVWLNCFAEKYLYLMDFTPLPIFMLLHAVASRLIGRTYSRLVLIANILLVFLCGMFSARDIYVFDYHMAISDSDPIEQLQHQEMAEYNNTTGARAAVGGLVVRAVIVSKGSLHLVMGAVALMELVLSVVLWMMYLKSFADTITVDLSQTRKRLWIFVSSAGATQMVNGVTLINFGFILFLSHNFTVEFVGDTCTLLGAFAFASGTIALLATFPCAASFAIPLGVCFNFATFLAIGQRTDGEGLLVSRMIAYDRSHPDPNYHRSYVFSRAAFGASLLSQLMCGLGTLGAERLMRDGRRRVHGDGGPGAAVEARGNGYQLVEGYRHLSS